MARIVSVSTDVPQNRFTQAEVKELCRIYFGPLFENGRAAIYDRSGVDARYLVEPREYYLSRPCFETRNKDFLKHALHLSQRCIRKGLLEARLDFSDVSHIFTVTTTGLLTPSLEAHLVQKLPFPRNVKRTPLFGVGCAGGVVGLSRAREYLRGHPGETVLLVSVELCSLTFRPEDTSMTQLVATTLFGDGAAAVFLAGEKADRGRPRAEVLASESLLLADSLDIMGWEFRNDGMRLMLSPEAPHVVEKHFSAVVHAFLKKQDLNLKQMDYFLFHPGSSKIMRAYEKALSLTPQDLRLPRRFLRNFGNLSSASVLFILEDVLQTERPASGSYGLLATLGPGFACELALLRFL